MADNDRNIWGWNVWALEWPWCQTGVFRQTPSSIHVNDGNNSFQILTFCFYNSIFYALVKCVIVNTSFGTVRIIFLVYCDQNEDRRFLVLKYISFIYFKCAISSTKLYFQLSPKMRDNEKYSSAKCLNSWMILMSSRNIWIEDILLSYQQRKYKFSNFDYFHS